MRAETKTFRYTPPPPSPGRWCGKRGREHDPAWVPSNRNYGVWMLRECQRCARIMDYCPPPALWFEQKACRCGFHKIEPANVG